MMRRNAGEGPARGARGFTAFRCKRCEEALGKLLKLRVLGHVLTLTTIRVAVKGERNQCSGIPF